VGERRLVSPSSDEMSRTHSTSGRTGVGHRPSIFVFSHEIAVTMVRENALETNFVALDRLSDVSGANSTVTFTRWPR